MYKQLVFVALFLFIGVYAEVANKAIVNLQGTIHGKIVFTETSKGVQIDGTIEGIPTGKHGFHVHSLGDLSNGCASTGSHFNPYNKTHGGPDANARHVGDLGNIEANATGVAKISILDKHIALKGETNIIGRAIVIHENPDDLGLGNHDDSLTTGHAGGRIACAIIGRLEGTGSGSVITNSLMLGFLSLSAVLFLSV